MNTSPAKGQVWIAKFDTTRVVKIVYCDDKAKAVTRYKDMGRPSLNRRPISYRTLQEAWYLEGSRPAPVVDESKLCEMKRGACYRMRYPSDAERGRILRLLQWDQDMIPGEGVGYEDVGADMKYAKALSVYHFRRKWEMVCESFDQFDQYLIKGEPLVTNERMLRGRAQAGHTREERDELAELRRKVKEHEARIVKLEAVLAGNVIPLASRRKKARR